MSCCGNRDYVFASYCQPKNKDFDFKAPNKKVLGLYKLRYFSQSNASSGEHRNGIAVSYQTAYYAIAKFRGNLCFVNITVTHLREYGRWVLQQDYSKINVGICIPSLRTKFNEATNNKIIRKERIVLGNWISDSNSKKCKKSFEAEKVWIKEHAVKFLAFT